MLTPELGRNENVVQVFDLDIPPQNVGNKHTVKQVGFKEDAEPCLQHEFLEGINTYKTDTSGTSVTAGVVLALMMLFFNSK